MNVNAPFFNDPPNPGGIVGQPFPELWESEVVEAFFLATNGRYLEVELCPHGQHLVLLLTSTRQLLKDQLPITFSSEIFGCTWHGVAEIPNSYFPPNVCKFNAYAIHGSGEARQYEALHPTSEGMHKGPDFHRLEYFQPIEFKKLLPENTDAELSAIWDS